MRLSEQPGEAGKPRGGRWLPWFRFKSKAPAPAEPAVRREGHVISEKEALRGMQGPEYLHYSLRASSHLMGKTNPEEAIKLLTAEMMKDAQEESRELDEGTAHLRAHMLVKGAIRDMQK